MLNPRAIQNDIPTRRYNKYSALKTKTKTKFSSVVNQFYVALFNCNFFLK